MRKKKKIQSFLDKGLVSGKNQPIVGNGVKLSGWESNNLDNVKDNGEKLDKSLTNFFSTVRTKDLLIQTDKNFEAFFQKVDFVEKTIIKPQYLKKSRGFLYKVAAILLPFAIIAPIMFYYLHNNNEEVKYEEVSTLKGSKTRIVLEDGTTVWLNSDSELKYPSTFKNKEKRVVKLAGEAFFNVTKNEKQLFEVHTGSYNLKVLGTAFNVKAYPGENKMQTTLEHGKVDVEKLSFEDGKPQHIVSLKPKQTIVIYDNKKQIEIHGEDVKKGAGKIEEVAEKNLEKKSAVLIESEDLSPYLAWKDNKLIFNEIRIIDMVNDLERWYNINIEVADESIKDLKFTATFTTETADQALQAICLAAKIDYDIKKDRVVLKAN